MPDPSSSKALPESRGERFSTELMEAGSLMKVTGGNSGFSIENRRVVYRLAPEDVRSKFPSMSTASAKNL